MKALVLPILLLASYYPAVAETPWTPPNGEYSVVFGGKPEPKEVASAVGDAIITSQTASCQVSEVAEKAESRPYVRNAKTTKDAAYKQGGAWANSFGLQNIELVFDDAKPDDVTLTIKGFKVIPTSTVSIRMNLIAIWHWGQNTIFVTWIAEPTQNYPSREGQRFLASVRQGRR